MCVYVRVCVQLGETLVFGVDTVWFIDFRDVVYRVEYPTPPY